MSIDRYEEIKRRLTQECLRLGDNHYKQVSIAYITNAIAEVDALAPNPAVIGSEIYNPQLHNLDNCEGCRQAHAESCRICADCSRCHRDLYEKIDQPAPAVEPVPAPRESNSELKHDARMKNHEDRIAKLEQAAGGELGELLRRITDACESFHIFMASRADSITEADVLHSSAIQLTKALAAYEAKGGGK